MTAIDPAEPCRALYRELVAERFPAYTEVLREAQRPVPAPPLAYCPPAVKASGALTRLEQLILATHAEKWQRLRGVR